MNIFKNTTLLFVFSFLFLSALVWYISFSFILPDYKNLQSEKNLQNIESLLQKMNRDIKVIKNVTNDYSKWDDTYEFMETGNKKYIFNNFRENSSTIEDLNLDFILFVKNDNTVLFSKYVQNNPIKDKDTFEKQIVDTIKDKTTYSSISIFNKKPLYLIKSEIFRSDESGELKGHIISGKLIDDETLKDYNQIFPSIEITNEKTTNSNNKKLSFEFIKDVNLFTKTKGSLENKLDFYIQDQYIFSLITKSDTNIVKRGFNTIIYYNSLVSLILLIVFFSIFKYQKRLESYNKELELKVQQRTKELSKTLRTVEQSNKKLYELSNTDSLTKIKNRRNFFEESSKLLKKAVDENKEFCILLIDIDHFKSINDKFGHGTGDEVLKMFCKIVNDYISEEEVFGRLGGEEFSIAFFDKELDFVEKIGNKIRAHCEKNIFEINNQKIKFTISLGLNSKDNLVNIDEILHLADENLYNAKNSGRNRLVRDTSKRL